MRRKCIFIFLILLGIKNLNSKNILIVKMGGGGLLTSSGQRPEMLLSIYQHNHRKGTFNKDRQHHSNRLYFKIYKQYMQLS